MIVLHSIATVVIMENSRIPDPVIETQKISCRLKNTVLNLGLITGQHIFVSISHELFIQHMHQSLCALRQRWKLIVCIQLCYWVLGQAFRVLVLEYTCQSGWVLLCYQPPLLLLPQAQHMHTLTITDGLGHKIHTLLALSASQNWMVIPLIRFSDMIHDLLLN